MPDTMAERRAAPRYPLILVAQVTKSGESSVLTGRSSEVSRTGCYIDTLNPPPVGTQVEVRLLKDDTVFQSAARVMYVCPGLGMGVAFHKDATPDQMAILDGWLKQIASGT